MKLACTPRVSKSLERAGTAVDQHEDPPKGQAWQSASHSWPHTVFKFWKKTARCAAIESDMCAQPARGSKLQKRAARLSIVMEDPQMRRPRFHAPRASLAFAEAWHPVFAKVEKVSTCALAGIGKQTIVPCCHDAAPPQCQHT